MIRRLALALALALAAPAPAAATEVLAGHGGPVMGIATAGSAVLTASFDYSVGYWEGGRPIWLEGHRAAVNTAIPLGGGRVASGSDDFTVRIWDLESGTSTVLEGHAGKVMGLASHLGVLASAGWDGRIGLWDVASARNLGWIEGHDGPVNAVLFAPDGRLFSASADGTVRIWDVAARAERRRLVRHGFGVNTLLLDPGGRWLAYGALDGGTRVVDPETGAEIADFTLDRRPILAMALAPGGGEIAVGDGEGYVMRLDTGAWEIREDLRLAARGPVWALAYGAGGARLYAGGIDDAAYGVALDAPPAGPVIGTGERTFLTPPAEMSNGERQFNRKCSVCHTLTPDGARRAGPTLHGLFGRPAGSLPDYPYSPALAEADIVWSGETVDDLFEFGPDVYTPGSKMPMQVIRRPEDRADLIAYLRRMTGGEGE